MTRDEEAAPVSGSDDARAGGKQAEKQRDEAAHQAERTVLKGRRAAPDDLETRSHALAETYLRLGGQRRAVMDDNITDTRKWEPDSPDAEAFWQENIAPLPKAQRKHVEEHLPSINED